MDVRILVETTFDNGEKRTHQLDGLSQPYRVSCPEGFRLRLEDGSEWTKHGGHAAHLLFVTVRRPSRTVARVTATL